MGLSPGCGCGCSWTHFGTWDLVPMPYAYAMDLVVSVPGVVLGWSNPIQSNPRRLGLIYPKE